MKGLTIKIQALLLCGVLITGLFSSCASDENIDNGNKVNAGDKVLTLTLNTPKTTTSGAKTRVTNMTQTDIGTNENQINLLTIGIFDKLGTTVRTIQELPLGTGTNTFTTTSGVSTATLVTNSLAADDQVLVAVNAPTTTFNGCKTVDQFKARTIAIDAALATPAGSTSAGLLEATNNIPMFSATAGTIVAPNAGETTYKATVAVQRQLAKITLNTLGVAFKSDGPYASATFKPTSFFLINVPDNLNYNAAAWNGSSAKWQGWDNSDAGKATYKEYLGTGPITTTVLAGTASVTPNTPINVFYTIPNNDATNNTKLVIGGEFRSDGTDATKTTVYYPVNINWVYKPAIKSAVAAEDGTDIKKVYPNRNYICDITIKTKGTENPTTTIDPEDVSVTVTVTKFTDVQQSTDFE